MWKLSVLAISLFFASTTFIAQSAPDETLPPGPMAKKATTACLECHEARIIVQQRLTKATWAKEVDKMINWGALVDPKDRDALIDYLSGAFGPDRPPYKPVRTAESKTKK